RTRPPVRCGPPTRACTTTRSGPRRSFSRWADRAELAEVTSAVPAEKPDDLAVLAGRDDELAAGPGPPLQRDLRGFRGGSLRLHADVVLVAPEVGDVGEGLVGAEQVRGHGHALFGGVEPVLDPHPGIEVRVVPRGHVAGGVDAGCGLAARVAFHTVVDGQPG